MSTTASSRSPKIERERLAVVARQFLDHEPHVEQPLEPLAEPIGEEAADAEAAMQEIGDAERQRKGEPGLGGALVAEPAVGARAFHHRVGVAHQRLHDGGRGGPRGERLQHQRPLLVAERHQRHGEALVLGEADPARPRGAPRLPSSSAS